MFDTALSPFGNTRGAGGFAGYPTKLVDPGADRSSYERVIVTVDDSYRRPSTFEYIVLHEIGHTIGLEHLFDGDTVLSEGSDSRENTVMSYTGRISGRLGPLDVEAVRHVYGERDVAHLSAWGWNAAARTLTQVATDADDRLSGVGLRDVMIAGSGDDVVAGFDGDDDPSGEAGDDHLDGGDGADRIDGGDGDDRLIGSGGDDELIGGNGDDTLIGGAGTDYLDGGAGDDTFVLEYGENAHDTYLGGEGRDVLRTYFPEVSRLILNAAASVETLDMGEVNIRGTAGADTIDLSGVDALARPGSFDLGDGADLFVGSADGDAAWADGGTNRLFGRAGEDYLGGGDGRDRLDGGDGDDHLAGGGGDDWLSGGAGADWLDSGEGVDAAFYASAGAGVVADLLRPDAGRGDGAGDGFVGIENLYGSRSGDSLRGDAGANVLAGGADNDALFGRAGADRVLGGAGNDRLFGSPGDDRVLGGAGNDVLDGGAGADRLRGDAGADRLFGGAGNDVFVYRSAADSRGGARDTILDFRCGQDRIDLSAIDADGAPDMAIELGGAGAPGASDFVL